MALLSPSRGPLAASLVAAVSLLVGCGGPTPAPSPTPPDAATAPVAATAVPLAEATGEPGGITGAAIQSLMAEEALVSIEERLQALDMRLTGLPDREGPVREAEVLATGADLGLMLDQLDIVIDDLDQGESAARWEHLERTVAAAAGLASLVNRFGALPDGTTLADPLRARADAALDRVNAIAARAPTAAPTVEPTATP